MASPPQSPNSIIIQAGGFRVEFPSSGPGLVVGGCLVGAAILATHSAVVTIAKNKGATRRILGMFKKCVQVVFDSPFDAAQQDFLLSANFREQLQILFGLPTASFFVTLDFIDHEIAAKKPTWIPVEKFDKLSNLFQDLVLGLPSAVDEELSDDREVSERSSTSASKQSKLNLETLMEPNLQWIAAPLIAFNAFQYSLDQVNWDKYLEASRGTGTWSMFKESLKGIFAYSNALKSIWETVKNDNEVHRIIRAMGIRKKLLPDSIVLSDDGKSLQKRRSERNQPRKSQPEELTIVPEKVGKSDFVQSRGPHDISVLTDQLTSFILQSENETLSLEARAEFKQSIPVIRSILRDCATEFTKRIEHPTFEDQWNWPSQSK